MAKSFSSPPTSKRRQPQADRPRSARPVSPSARSPPSRGRSPIQRPGAGPNAHTHAHMLTRPTTGFLSPRKAIGKHLVPSSSGGHVAYVATQQMVPPASPEYTPGANVRHALACMDVRLGSRRFSPLPWIGRRGSPLTPTRSWCDAPAQHRQ
jgi:hypothetical protein